MGALGHSLPRSDGFETDPDHTSEVEIRFVAETSQRTRLELEYRNIERRRPN